MMDYLDAIKKRCSIRVYREEPLDEKIIDGLADFLSGLEVPEKQVDWNFDTLPYLDMVRISVREPAVTAPQYLVLRCDSGFFGLQNAGYLGEYASLYLTGIGVASVWQGNIHIDPEYDFIGSLRPVSVLAFGMSDLPFRSDPSQADRLPLERIAGGEYGEILPIIEAARLSPSSYNRQPWFFQVEDNRKIHIFRTFKRFTNSLTEYDQSVDAGVAIANVEAAAIALGYRPHTGRIKIGAPERKGCKYQATVILGDKPKK